MKNWKMTQGSLSAHCTDPLHVAEDQDEQGPEENGDDSCSDEDHNLHVGLIAGAFTHTHTQNCKMSGVTYCNSPVLTLTVEFTQG